MSKTLRCPVCRKSLTQKEYERALNIVELQSRDLEKLKKLNKNLKGDAKKAKSEGIKIGKDRSRKLFAGQQRKVQTLQERIKQLEKGKTPQTEGFKFERVFERELRKLFGEEDEVIRKGKEGDVLHIVRFRGEEAGRIVYELKKTTDIKDEYIQQTHEAKREQNAHFAVLITSGKKKGFDGLAENEGIFIVAPAGAMALVLLLRTHLIEMLRAKLTKEKRMDVARKLVKYINGPLFQNPIREVVKTSHDLEKLLKSEAKSHFKIWEKRWNHYQLISWNSSEVRNNISLVMWGKDVKEVKPVRVMPLHLPRITD